MNRIQADLSDLRREYRNRPLNRQHLHTDPLVQFERWFNEALETEAMDPNAMSLATADTSGQPSMRTVLLKFFDEQGFVFYTNFESQKAKDIDSNAQVALLFYWHEVHRQVVIRGKAERIATEDSQAYFARRPRDSQLGAWASQQSSVVSSRAALEQAFAAHESRFDSKDIPLPDFWGGYRVRPVLIEFWQGRESRLHDRFLYTADAAGKWHIDRLAP